MVKLCTLFRKSFFFFAAPIILKIKNNRSRLNPALHARILDLIFPESNYGGKTKGKEHFIALWV